MVQTYGEGSFFNRFVLISQRRKGDAMKRVLLLIAGLLGGLFVGLLLPTEQREKISRQLAGTMGGMVEHMPDG